MSEWQPIDSAPKDGTSMDLWVIPINGAPAGRMPNMHWFAGCFRFPCFSSDPGVYGQVLSAEATHWMPLPDPPK